MEIITFTIPWQNPVITEKYSYSLIKNSKETKGANTLYFACPWATILDTYNLEKIKRPSLKLIDKLPKLAVTGIQNFDDVITVCQTYGFRKLIPVFSEFGIKKVFTPHALKSQFSSYENRYGIEVFPYPLYPVNVGYNPTTEFKYLYSFIGYINYKGGEEAAREEATILRNKLVYEVKHSAASLVMPIERWHFNEIVYKQDILGKKLNAIEEKRIELRTRRYREVLSNSRFALCPKGMGPASIRFWEALGSGAIPVNISDDFWLPGEEYFDWDSCVVTVKEKDILDIPDILNEISEEQEHEMRKNALKAFKMFTGENFISPIKYHLLGEVPQVD